MTLCLASTTDEYPVTPMLRSMPASPLECAHPKNVSLSPVQSALKKSLDLNPPGMNSYKKGGGFPLLAKQKARRQGGKEEGSQGTANRLLTPCLTRGENSSCFPASLPSCFLLRGRLECASILLWAAFAEGGKGSSGKMQKQACLAIIFLAGLAMGFQMTTGELEAQDRGQARSMAISRDGIVAAGSPLAAQAGGAGPARGGGTGAAGPGAATLPRGWG